MAQTALPSEEKKDRLLCIPPKPEVLIVCGSCGTLEVYTSRHMRLHVAKRLRGLPDTIEADLAAEAYLEMRLPSWAQELFAPENLQKRDTIRLLTPSQEVERRTRLALVRECRAIMEERNAKRK